ncbi:hypothetical protein PINS_up015621 [Pythium insidiosum]|nr:hypothetical protein PINS_up015621 [Pythium insidiosum]
MLYCRFWKAAFKQLLRFQVVVQDDIHAAEALLETLSSIRSLALSYPTSGIPYPVDRIDFSPGDDNPIIDMNRLISSMALEYLQHDWSEGDKKYSYKSSSLDVFLKSYLLNGQVVIDNIQALAINGLLELIDQGGTQAVLLFKILVGITKSFQKALIVATVLKAGRRFVETIIRSMPFLQRHFVSHNERVLRLISEVQVATRRMQVLCAHGKLIKDAAAASQVPMVKRLLERFIYRGEELARAHGVLDAFTTGVLKNRRIDGTTISKEELEAQPSESDDDTEEEDQEEQETVGSEDEEDNPGERSGEDSDTTASGVGGDDDDGPTQPSAKRRK